MLPQATMTDRAWPHRWAWRCHKCFAISSSSDCRHYNPKASDSGCGKIPVRCVPHASSPVYQHLRCRLRMAGVAELLSLPVIGSSYNGTDECVLRCNQRIIQKLICIQQCFTGVPLCRSRYGSLVNVHGVIIDRQTRSSDHYRWCECWLCFRNIESALHSPAVDENRITRYACVPGPGTGQEASGKL